MRLLVIEDSLRLQELLRGGLSRAGFAVDVVGDGDAGLACARRDPYDVIVLDLMLPGLDGLELLRQLRAAGNDTSVLILTAKHTVEDRVRGLQLGADDYLQKPFAFDELLARVQALVRRRYPSKGPQIAAGDLLIDTVTRQVKKSGTEILLTKREYQIVEYLARRRGEVVKRIEIEDHVYGRTNLPASNAVESAICTIRRKLRDAGENGCIRTLHGVGYRLEG